MVYPPVSTIVRDVNLRDFVHFIDTYKIENSVRVTS